MIQLRKFVVNTLEAFFNPRVKRIAIFVLRWSQVVAHRDARQRPLRKWVGGRRRCISFIKFVFAVTGHVLTVRVVDFREHFGLLLLPNLTDWKHITFDGGVLQKMINSILVVGVRS